MPDSKTNVLLVTTDARLRQTVQRHQPPDISLHCATPAELAGWQSMVRSVEVWLDLDCGLLQGLPPGNRRVYFHSRNQHSGKNLTPGLFIRKPCTTTVARVLWAGVQRGNKAQKRKAYNHQTDGLPAWLPEFHELGLRELCRKCVSRLPARLGYRDVSMYLHDLDEGLLTLAETTHTRPIDLAISTCDNRTHLLAEVARGGKLLLTNDVRHELKLRGLRPPDEKRQYADATCLLAPLVSGGQLWGMLSFSHRDLKLAPLATPYEPVFAFIGRALRYARAYDRARTEARVDDLTSLYNHRWVVETLTKEIRRTQRFNNPLATILADLDGLKAVNDRVGHSAGDWVLRHVARRINSALRQFDSAARVGGDEFVILLPATDLAGAQQVAQRVLDAIRSDAPIYRNMPLPTQASLGVAQWQPEWTAHQLIDAADKAMYRAKQQGCNRVVCCPHTTIESAPQAGAPAQTPPPVINVTVPSRTVEPTAVAGQNISRFHTVNK
ncbi:MAG: sensor domain-containing diguanylate cyclase [Planctomycetota bacterium]